MVDESVALYRSDIRHELEKDQGHKVVKNNNKKK